MHTSELPAESQATQNLPIKLHFKECGMEISEIYQIVSFACLEEN